MDYAQKEQVVAEMHAAANESEGMFLAHNLGLEAAPIGKIRRQVLGVEACARVAKNRLVARALEGTKFESLKDELQGPVMYFYGKDPVGLAKVLVAFAKENDRLKLLKGIVGKDTLDTKGIEALSKLPGLNELRGTLVGILQAPAQKLAAVAQAPAGQLARVVNAYATKDAA